MKIRDVEPGTTVTISEGPAKGREVTVTMAGSDRVAVRGSGDNGLGQIVRGDLEVE